MREDLSVREEGIYSQIVYLDFDGAETVYNNAVLGTEYDITVKDSRISAERQEWFLDELNRKYAGNGFIFTNKLTDNMTDYSTVYVGMSDDFDTERNFFGISETIDVNNQNKNDDAYVFFDCMADDEQIFSVIDHEVGHILFGTEHTVTATGTILDYATQSYLLSTKWSQSSPYNKYCPIDPVTGKRCVTGCSQTAVGQIIYYWLENNLLDFNLTLTANDAYVSKRNGTTITIDSSQENASKYGYLSFSDVNSYLQNFSVGNTDFIAALCFAAGVIQEADYSSNATGAISWSEELFSRAGFDDSVSLYHANNTSDSAYIGNCTVTLYGDGGYGTYYCGLTSAGWQLLVNDIKAGRPVGLSIRSAEGNGTYGGHAIVADGYDSSTGKVHLNFGWGGYGDTWCTLDELNTKYCVYRMAVGIDSSIENIENFVKIYSSGTVTSQGSSITGAVLKGGYNNSMYVSSGGVASNTVVSSGGYLYVSNGGVVNSTTVNSSGYMRISNGGIMSRTTVNSGGSATFSGGAILKGSNSLAGAINIVGTVSASSATVNLSVDQRKTTDSYIITNLSLISGAPAYTITVSASQAEGTYKLALGASSFSGSITVKNTSGTNYGTLTVNGSALTYGDKKYSLVKDSSGNLTLNVAAKTNYDISANYTDSRYGEPLNISIVTGTYTDSSKITVSDNVYVDWLISNEADAINEDFKTALYLDNELLSVWVCSGGLASGGIGGVDDYNLGKLTAGSHTLKLVTDYENVIAETNENNNTYTKTFYVSSANVASNVKVYSHGTVTSQGSSITGAVLKGEYNNSMYVSSGGMASNTVVSSGGYLYVSNGGVANSTTVNSYGYLDISSGGVANSTTVNSKGYMIISSGGVANSTTVNSRGGLYIYSGGNATAIKENGGYVEVAEGANVTFVANTLSGLEVSYGCATVHSGTVANSTTVDYGGSMYIYSGGVANSTTVNSYGGLDVSSGGVANETTVNSSGYLRVSSGGIANSTTVNSSGRMYVSNGGSAEDIDVDSFAFVSIGGRVNRISASHYGFYYVSNGGIVSSAVISHGKLSAGNGGTVSNARIKSWGTYYITSGGSAVNTIIESNGRLNIYSGASLNSTTVNSGGYVNNFQLKSSIVLNTSDGSFTLNNVYVNSSYTGLIDKNQTVNGTTVSSDGSMQINNGGTHKGSMQIASGAVVSAYSGSVIDFTVSNRTTADTYLINNLSLISGAPTYTITVSASQVEGTYKLAQGASSFTGSITIGDGTTTYGNLTVNGESISNNDFIYQLQQNSGNLTLTITEVDKIPPEAPTVSADITTATNKNVTVTASFSSDSVVKQYSLNNSTWLNYTSGIVMRNNGTVYFRGADEAGNISDVTSYTVSNIDRIAPVKPTASANITSATNSNVIVSASFSSDSVVKQYSLNNSTWMNYTSGIVMQNNGTVYFRGTDAAGNFSNVTSYAVSNIDKIAPVKPTASADITTATNKNVTVTASFSSDSVVKQYSLNNSTWLNYTSGVVMKENGTVYFRGADAAGNISDVASYAVSNIDKIAPVKPTASANITSATNGNVIVSASFSSDSVVKQYSLNNSTWMNYTSGIVMQNNGTVYFRGTDAAGNFSDVASYAVNNIDKIAPVKPTASANITSATNSNVIVSASFSSDSVVKQYSLNNSTWLNYTSGIVMRNNGTVYFRGADEAGNISDVTSYTVSNIDRIAPVKPTASANITTATNKNVTVTASFSSDSVVKQYSLNNSTWLNYTSGVVMKENGTVYFRGADAAGNFSNVTNYAVSNIDRIAPVKPTASANITSATNSNVIVSASFSRDSVVKQYSLNNSTWLNYTSGVVMKENGTVYFRGADAAGNFSNVTSYAVSNIDRIAPVKPTASANITSATNSNVIVSASFSSDSVVKQYSLNNSTWLNYTSGVVMKENGTVYFRSKDDAGNFSDIVSYTVSNINKIPPVFASNVKIYSSGTVTSQGSFITGAVLKGGYNNSMYVSSGGVVSNTVVSRGGNLYISNGGVANSTTVNYSGYIYIKGGGIADNTTVNSDGCMYISSGGAADNTVVSSGGNLYVSNGGVASSTTVNTSGKMYINRGGFVENTTVNSDGCMYISNGGVVDSTIVNDGGFIYIYSSGVANDTINYYGLHVCKGGVANRAVNNNGMYISSGGVANNTINNSTMHISSGGTANSTTVSSGGLLTVFEDGVASRTTVNSGGDMTVSSGGTANNTIINNYGNVILSSGGVVNVTTVNSAGGLHVYSGATASNTTVKQSGYLGVGLGATTYNTTIDYAGELTVWGGGKVYNNTINQYGAIILSSGAMADSSVINSQGGLHVYSGAVASNTTVKQKGIFGVGLGATTYNTTIDYAGELKVWGGGKVYNNTINEYGAIILLSGAMADTTTINSQGGLHVYSGAVASNTTVKQGGFFGVGDGATTYNTLIDYAGELTVWGGGLVNDNEINQWGAIILSSGAAANRTIINPDGGLHIYNGATAYSTQVTSGAKLGIGSGGYLYGSELDNTGTMIFYDGAILGGWNDFEGTVITSGAVEASGAYVHFELDDRSASQGVILDNIGNLYSVERYSMEVDADQVGTFQLAAGASDFNDRITLYVEEDNDCGSLAAGESLEYDGKRYTLTNKAGILALKIS